MAIIVEDGTGVEDAVSYASLADADAYFSARAVTAWTGTDAAKEAALVKATDYVETRFASSFIGSRESTDQPLSWPRRASLDGADLTGTVPDRLKKAVMEYALQALTTELLSVPADQNVAGEIVRKKEKIGPVEREVEYAATAQAGAAVFVKTFPQADILISSLINRSGEAIR